MLHRHLRVFMALLTATALATPGHTQAPSFDALPGGETSEATWPLRLVVEDFDPALDVPAMVNWVPDTEFDGGAAHCFAMTVLTYYAWKRIDFTAETGLPAAQWKADTPADTPVALDEDGMPFVMEWAKEHPDQHIRVGGAANLRAYTAAGTQTETLFTRVAEALQFSMQIPTNIGRYVRNMVFGSVDLLKIEGRGFTPRDINVKGVEEMKARLAAGKLAPFTAHPLRPRTDGHVLLAYSLEETAETYTFELYDFNYPPLGNRPRPGKLILEKAGGTFRMENYSGREVYTTASRADPYELLTPLRPDRRFERWVFWRIVTHVDEYLAVNKWIFDRLGEAQQAGRDAKAELGEIREKGKERFEQAKEGAKGRIRSLRSRTRNFRKRLGL